MRKISRTIEVLIRKNGDKAPPKAAVPHNMMVTGFVAQTAAIITVRLIQAGMALEDAPRRAVDLAEELSDELIMRGHAVIIPPYEFFEREDEE